MIPLFFFQLFTGSSFHTALTQTVLINSHIMKYVAVSIFEYKMYFIYSSVNWQCFTNICVFFTVMWRFKCSCAINSWQVGHFFLRFPFSTRALTTVDPKNEQTKKQKNDF